MISKSLLEHGRVDAVTQASNCDDSLGCDQIASAVAMLWNTATGQKLSPHTVVERLSEPDAVAGAADELWDDKQVADHLSVSVHAIRHWRRSGRLSAVHLTNRVIRFRRSAVEAFIAAGDKSNAPHCA